MEATPIVSIGIVTHDSAKLIGSCLAKIQELHDDLYRVTVLDNNSSDETKTIIRNKFPNVKLIESEFNYGFGVGVNKLLEDSESKYVLVLNPDVVLNKNTLKPLFDDLEANTETIVSAPITIDAQGKPEFNVRRFPTIRTQLFESLLGGNLARRFSQSELVQDIDEYPKLEDIDWIKGAIWMIRKESFQKIGGMRNDFFLYSEETEFAWRAKSAGHSFSIAPGSTATHIGGESDTNPLLFSLLALNKLHMMKVINKRFGLQTIRIFLILGSLLRLNKPASRRAFGDLIKSFRNLENQRANIVKELNGTIETKS